ncbi:hypothetical protein F2P81_003476 [Scophthalmus maximus]|uniref:Uncharacterized protein n=1 Tax=Scophthalmus maximus TaxID=52904 RepID=A0A6A4TIJ6_SCOMX|nr:hypothetical protein F2P81_003476 [Scophthalmus maximus]
MASFVTMFDRKDPHSTCAYEKPFLSLNSFPSPVRCSLTPVSVTDRQRQGSPKANAPQLFRSLFELLSLFTSLPQRKCPLESISPDSIDRTVLSKSQCDNILKMKAYLWDAYRPYCSDDQSVVRKDNNVEFIPILSGVLSVSRRRQGARYRKPCRIAIIGTVGPLVSSVLVILTAGFLSWQLFTFN